MLSSTFETFSLFVLFFECYQSLYSAAPQEKEMFAFEINFTEGVSAPLDIIIKRFHYLQS